MGNENKLKNVNIVQALLNIKLSKLKDKGNVLRNNVKQIEKLLNYLDENNLSDNTVICIKNIFHYPASMELF